MRITSEAAGGRGKLETRALWERNVRRGKSERISYRVQGWQTFEGRAWSHNLRVHVHDPALSVMGEWIVASATLVRDASGTVTDLELARPESFLPDPKLPKVKKGKSRKKKAPMFG